MDNKIEPKMLVWGSLRRVGDDFVIAKLDEITDAFVLILRVRNKADQKRVGGREKRSRANWRK